MVDCFLEQPSNRHAITASAKATTWRRPGSLPSRCQAHRPPDAAQDMLLEARIFPDLLSVPQGGIEDTAIAFHPRPGNGIVPVFPFPLGGIDGSIVDAQDDMLVVPRPIAELIDLILDLRIFGKRPHTRKIRILDAQADLLEPRVAVEVASDHLAVRVPLVKRIGGSVHPHEAMTGPYPLHKYFLILVGDGQLTRRIGENNQIDWL